MYCASCGRELSEGAAFCEDCGTPVNAPAVGEGPAGAVPADSAAQVPSAAGAQTLNWRVVGPVLAVAIAAVALVAVLALQGGLGGKKTTPAGQPSATMEAPTITFEGAEISALARPTLVAFAAEGPSSGGSGTAISAAVPNQPIDPDLGNVLYVDDVFGSRDASAQKQKLAENGFVVVKGGTGFLETCDEFYERYEKNRYNKLPSFVTTDSMMHTYHLFFSHLLKNTEREYLSDALTSLSGKMLKQSEEQLEKLKGTEWEDAAKRNVAFFAVGSSLLDPATSVPESVAPVVGQELSLVQGAGGVSKSPLFSHDVDYSQYTVRGYYEGDPVLEPYFRAMMWYGQANFLHDDEALGDDLDRSALLMTMALDKDSFSQWESIYAVTSFFAGASDDCGYYEYKPLIDAAYGEGADVGALAGNEGAWKRYHEMTAQMSAPQINSAIGASDGDSANDEDKGYRFMGQRFSIDAAIFQHLIYDDVGENAEGGKRLLPNALDVPAALGSDEAYSILQSEGETGYAGYDANMKELRDEYADESSALWNASLASRWLYTLNPLLEKKGDGWPSFMQSAAWARKNLQGYLGSYTELKHDTVLYSKQAMAEAGGMVNRTDDRGYVEPEPELYRRLTQLASSTSDGLAKFGMLSSEDKENMALLSDLASRLTTISEKELRNENLSDDDYELIRSYGVQLEHFWEEAHKGDSNLERITHWDFPAAIVTDVATGDDKVLELGTGRPSTIYVVVPVDGELRLASGTVFSFYQFDWPASDRLTDSKWRDMMGFITSPGGSRKDASGINPEEWTQSFQVG